MSRFGEWDGDDFPGQSALWTANVDRALKGRRGRQALRDLREALLALPEPRLIEGAMCTIGSARRAEFIAGAQWHRDLFAEIVAGQGEGVCSIGAYIWRQRVKAGMDPQEAFGSLPTIWDGGEGEGGDETALEGARAGLTYTLAWHLASENDSPYVTRTPEQRWQSFMDWIGR